ncbi:FACT complex subunit pob3 [Cladophialophora carrionii]|uniref:FACT complex subunit POB3 n=1 Tax=Cladophialophora carrionii TaxID=86049 RepID=A0A1C1CCC0_9EURO|nr:FACT complex subunit pob3 [Cladophialophora carrionii]
MTKILALSVQANAIPDNALIEDAKDERSVRDPSPDPTDTQVAAPASASQIYHAALLNSRTLDEILAAFEADEPHRGIVVDRILIRRNPKAYLSAEHLDATEQYKRQRYRSASIHSTADGAAHPGVAQDSAPNSAVQPSMQIEPQRPETPDPDANAGRLEAPAECGNSTQSYKLASEPLPYLCTSTRAQPAASKIDKRRQAVVDSLQRTRCNVNPTASFLYADQTPGETATKGEAKAKLADRLNGLRRATNGPDISCITSTGETFENIYLDLSRQSGRCRLAESGLGWKPSGQKDSEPFTLDSNQIGAAQWSRAAKGYELKIITRDAAVIQLDGFEQDDFDRVAKAFKIWYGINVENKEHALRGWNWGKAEFGRAELAFNVQNRPAFEIPYSEISNTNLAGKNEIAVEFNLGAEQNGTNGHKADSTKNRGRKAAAGRDELVEMRFYIPGTVSNKEVNGDQGSGAENDEEEEERNAAYAFYEMLMHKANIGDVAGATFATFQDILHLTPRGRFDIDMYENSFRLRGKTYDYKIQYQDIKKFFILPKNDEMHTLITLGLDPPLRQGQTRYPFIVMQLKLDDEVNLDLNMSEEMLETKYKDKLDAHYEAPIHHVIAKVFKGLSGKKIIMPSKDFVSHHNMNGVKCSIKANEGLLYCLDKSFMFVPKPATYVQIESIQSITMSRVGGALAASRTFDITMTLKGGQGEHQFSNINREEQQPLEAFFQAKGIRFKNEMMEDSSTLLKAALDDQELASSDDEEDAGVNRGSANEDDESPDEDFQEESESDVAEEYDSAHESEGSDASDAGMADADDDAANGASEEEDDRPPKKKAKK